MIVEIVNSFLKYNAGEKFNFPDNEAEALIRRGLAKIVSIERAPEQKTKPITQKQEKAKAE